MAPGGNGSPAKSSRAGSAGRRGVAGGGTVGRAARNGTAASNANNKAILVKRRFIPICRVSRADFNNTVCGRPAAMPKRLLVTIGRGFDLPRPDALGADPRPQHFRHEDGAVALLIVFEYGNERSR